MKSATPLVLLAGDTPADDREHPQDANQRAFIEATGARFEPLRSPKTVADDLARAFFRVRTERQPVVFDMPIEFQWLDAPE